MRYRIQSTRTRLLLAVLIFLALVGPGLAEVSFKSLSATATSQTWLFVSPRANVLICNYGTNEVYYRLFVGSETTGAATTSSAMLVAGSATAPACISFPKPATAAAYYSAISVVCDTAETATVHVISQ